MRLVVHSRRLSLTIVEGDADHSTRLVFALPPRSDSKAKSLILYAALVSCGVRMTTDIASTSPAS